jgi:hypothetical protein
MTGQETQGIGGAVVEDKQFQQLLDSQIELGKGHVVLVKELSLHSTRLAVMDEKLDRLVKHADDVNGSLNRVRARLEVLEQTAATRAPVIQDVPAIETRLSVVERLIAVHPGTCPLIGRIEAMETSLKSGETAAGKLAQNALKIVEDLRRWKAFVTGGLAVISVLVTSCVVLLSVLLNHILGLKP